MSWLFFTKKTTKWEPSDELVQEVKVQILRKRKEEEERERKEQLEKRKKEEHHRLLEEHRRLLEEQRKKSLSVKEIQKEKEEIEREKKRIEEEMDAPMADTLMHLENECKAKMERAYRESNGKVPHILCETNYSREYKLGEEKSAFPWERRFKSLQARGRFNNFRMSCESIAIEQIGTWDKHERKCELTILHL